MSDRSPEEKTTDELKSRTEDLDLAKVLENVNSTESRIEMILNAILRHQKLILVELKNIVLNTTPSR